MPTDEEIQERILRAIKDKIGTPRCPLCGNNNWNAGDRYVVLSLSPHPTRVSMGGPAFPMVAIICSHCGNTHFLNLFTLGFSTEELESMGLGEDGGK